ncbi:unnamed protein product [Staurois parvus]|uniref:Uncharacterized protein n=1 Tax=Staurois parvus TaxID=386267 RepID=A0ABN9FV85_9NEOB|nr:unnamed protein product [Staurois parvus]
MTFFKIFKISRHRRRRRPYVPMSQGPQHRSRMPAFAGGDELDTLQGTHRGSEGQGKLCRDSLCSAAW